MKELVVEVMLIGWKRNLDKSDGREEEEAR
jgi:hypothetical protein